MNTPDTSNAVLSAKPAIRPCKCNHAAQDEFHGKGKRVHNPCKKQGPGIGYRCTVCGDEK
jgi:hypothetical protein